MGQCHHWMIFFLHLVESKTFNSRQIRLNELRVTCSEELKKLELSHGFFMGDQTFRREGSPQVLGLGIQAVAFGWLTFKSVAVLNSKTSRNLTKW